MSIRNVARFAGATRQIRQSAQNLQAIRSAREKNSRDKELFELNKKKTNLQIEELKLKGDKSAVEMKFIEEIFKQQTNAQNDIQKGKDAQIDLAEQKERDKAEGFAKQAQGLMGDPDVSSLMTGVTAGLPPTSSVAQNVNRRVPRKQNNLFDKFTVDIGPSGRPSVRKKTENELFDEGFRSAESGDISFEDLETKFPRKRKQIKEQRILGLPEKSQRLLAQIDTEIKEDAKAARKVDEISNPEDVIADFLTEIVENRAEAERAGHNVNEILSILGVTEQEILDNKAEPKEGFLKKILDNFTLLGQTEKLSSLFKGE